MSDTVTPDRVREWRAMAKAATPGPWTHDRCIFRPVVMGGDLHVATVSRHSTGRGLDDATLTHADADLIAASREAVPAICDALETAWRELDDARSVARSCGTLLVEERKTVEEYEAALTAHGAPTDEEANLVTWLRERMGERDRLLAALRRHGGHPSDCPRLAGGAGFPCNCGWDATRRDLLGEGEGR